jgi:glycogen synthase
VHAICKLRVVAYLDALLLLLLPQVGGLGDVVTSLAKAHQASGTLVEVIMPKYDCANYRWAFERCFIVGF